MRSTVFAVLLGLHAVRAGEALDVVDDSDMRIQYTDGAWTSYRGLDPSLNWAGTVTFTNTSGATAKLSFVGDSVTVYGAFTPVGTYNMRSQYILDEKPPVVFSPPDTVQTEKYRQQFYASGPIPYGSHSIRVQNLGEQFWLDSIQVTQPDDVSTTASPNVGTTTSEPSQPTSAQSNTDTDSPPFSGPSPSGSHGTSTAEGAQSSSAQSTTMNPEGAPLSKPLQSTMNSESTSLSSSLPSGTQGTGAMTSERSQPSSAQSTMDPGRPSLSGPSSSDGGQSSSKSSTMLPALIAGVTLVAVIILLSGIVGGLFWWRYRGKRRHAHLALTSFDAQEPSSATWTKEPPSRGAVRGNAESLINTWRSQTDASRPHDALPVDGSHTVRAVEQEHDGSAVNKAAEAPRSVHRSSPSTTVPNPDPPLASPPNTSAASPHSPAVEGNLPIARATVAPRRSVDGGIRIAGGPAGEEVDFPEVETLSISSTLPPMYQSWARTDIRPDE
ncbi:hypothetical protein BD414DRAFT_529463 [Trametes punicea]|nr:hypothetical protein BD414DRAFT_529463 [Trametes punicea]